MDCLAQSCLMPVLGIECRSACKYVSLPMYFALIPLAAFVGCYLSLAWLLRGSVRLPLDHANARSLHTQVTPRIGGVGIACGVTLAMSVYWSQELAALLAAGFALALVSLLDDYLDLSAWLRLLAHLLVVALFLAITLDFSVQWWFALFMLLALTWMTNLFNFMDGTDGLAGGMALLGFAAYAWIAWSGGNFPLAILCSSVSAAVLAFLIFNFPPARLFMGDAGAVPLGFLAGAVGFVGWHDGLWHGITPLVIFSPFIVDATATLLKRGVASEKFWKAHRSHYYQRLVRMGWSHRRLALTEYVLMSATALSGSLYLDQTEYKWGLVMFWGVFYVAVMVAVDLRWRSAESGI